MCLLTVIVGSALHSSIRRGQQSGQALTILLQDKTNTRQKRCQCIADAISSIKHQNTQRFSAALQRTNSVTFQRHNASAPQNKALCTTKIIYIQEQLTLCNRLTAAFSPGLMRACRAAACVQMLFLQRLRPIKCICISLEETDTHSR